MTQQLLQPRVLAFMCLLPLASCALISESGPLKGKIHENAAAYNLIEVKSRADIPAAERNYGRADVPQSIKGQGYSDKVRSRDTLEFIITDLSEQSPFFSQQAYRYGPLEVPEDGRISIPYVGEIQVSGLSLADISADLGEKIKPVSNTARCSVNRSGRQPRTANVIGEVGNPGPVPLERAGLTSLDLLAAAGGPKGQEHLFTYNLRRGSKDHAFDYLGFRQHPFIIEEGDLLTVSAASDRRFHVMGAINRPISIVFPSPSPTLADALGAATGLDEMRSDPSGVFVFRKGNPDSVYTFNFKDPVCMSLIQRFPICGEDIVYVTEAPIVRWNRLLNQLLPSSVYQLTNTANRYSRQQ